MGWWRPVPEALELMSLGRPTYVLSFLSGKTQAAETHMWTFWGLEFWVGARLMANSHITLTINETICSCALLVLSIRKHLHYWLQNHIQVLKQWALHWVQIHQGSWSQQKTRFTHWQKWKRSLSPYSCPQVFALANDWPSASTWK